MNFIKNLFSKRKDDEEVILSAYTNDALVFENFQISDASHYYPNWWKNIPAKVYRNDAPYASPSYELPTMRQCAGFIELYKKSFVYPLWADLEINVEGDENSGAYNYRFGFDYEYPLQSHGPHERGSFLPPEKYVHIKTPPVWALTTSEALNWVTFGASWNQEDTLNKLFFFPGMEDYSLNHSTTWQFMVENVEQSIFLPAGTPLVHMVPLTSRPVRVESHFDPDMFSYLSRATSSYSFTGGYYQKKKRRPKVETRGDESKCPFPH